MAQADQQLNSAVNALAILNKLCLNAFRQKKRKSLIFQILNDTAQLIKYDRAVLWGFKKEKVDILGISGQTSVKKDAAIVEQWQVLIKGLREYDKPQILSAENFEECQEQWEEFAGNRHPGTLLWFPIFYHDDIVMGMWIERWSDNSWKREEMELLQFLMQAYGLAWDRFKPKFSLKWMPSPLKLAIAAVVISLFFIITVPLRVVAPCEVIAKDSIAVTAPLNGIIEKMEVTPGEVVKNGDVLCLYDKQVPMQELKIARQHVMIAQSEFQQAVTGALTDGQQREADRDIRDLAILSLKLQREKIRFELAEYHVSKLDVMASANGVVVLDDPEDWRGRPVRVGETLMKISDPTYSRIKIWIPEADNIELKTEKPITIVLNAYPGSTNEATLSYVAPSVTISDRGVPSFVAEADWIYAPEKARMGLKGFAVLYGERTSLFYWIVRKPWAAIRRFFSL